MTNLGTFYAEEEFRSEQASLNKRTRQIICNLWLGCQMKNQEKSREETNLRENIEEELGALLGAKRG